MKNKVFLSYIADIVREEFEKKAPLVYEYRPTKGDMTTLEGECMKSSAFDQLGARLYMWDNYVKGKARIEARRCEYGIMIVMLLPGQFATDVPWELWARLFRMFGGGVASHGFRVFLCAHPSQRLFPENEYRIQPANINGGYTYPCQKDTIVIYRAEDATRVLIHELFHASCSDRHEKGIDWVEAETEAWAELIYCAVMAEGRMNRFREMIQKQSVWMDGQNTKIRRHHIRPYSMEFPWRYTIGKQIIWEKWGIFDVSNERYAPALQRNMSRSLRLTVPPNIATKRLFGVRGNSTMV